MALKVFTFNRPLSWSEIETLDTSALVHGWLNNLNLKNPNFTLAADSQNLYFAFQSLNPISYSNQILSGEFHEGLWNWDIAELFIKADDSNAYQEFNLAPNGSWWSSVFSEKRKKTEFSCKEINVNTQVFSLTQQGWHSGISIPRNQLGITCSFGNKSKILISSILGNKTRNYYTSSKIPLPEPDFHQPEYFTNVLQIYCE